jgi:hypothetical protein
MTVDSGGKRDHYPPDPTHRSGGYAIFFATYKIGPGGYCSPRHRVTLKRPISVYRQVYCPYGVQGRASALSAGKREQVECPYRVATKALALGAGNDIQKLAYSRDEG